MGFDLSQYETVETRLERFWSDHPQGRVTTDLIHHDGQSFIVKAFLFRADDERAFATGYAEEIVGSSPVNKTSAAENAETSAIGRALANAGYAAKGKRPSREEMGKAQRYEDDPPGSEVRPQRHSKSISSGGGTVETRLATEKQRAMLRAKLKAKGYDPKALPAAWAEAGLTAITDTLPFSMVNPALEFIESLEPVT